MKNRLSKKRITDIAERLGWSVSFADQERDDTKEKEKYVEFSQYSTAGQDFSFYVFYERLDEVPDKVCEFYECYDIGEEVLMWLEAKQNGVGGVPDVVTLVEDQKDIKKMIEDLFISLERGEVRI